MLRRFEITMENNSRALKDNHNRAYNAFLVYLKYNSWRVLLLIGHYCCEMPLTVLLGQKAYSEQQNHKIRWLPIYFHLPTRMQNLFCCQNWRTTLLFDPSGNLAFINLGIWKGKDDPIKSTYRVQGQNLDFIWWADWGVCNVLVSWTTLWTTTADFLISLFSFPLFTKVRCSYRYQSDQSYSIEAPLSQ